MYREAEINYYSLKKQLIEKLLDIKKLYMRDKTLFQSPEKAKQESFVSKDVLPGNCTKKESVEERTIQIKVNGKDLVEPKKATDLKEEFVKKEELKIEKDGQTLIIENVEDLKIEDEKPTKETTQKKSSNIKSKK